LDETGTFSGIVLWDAGKELEEDILIFWKAKKA
jgi:hypothetical protein